MRDYATPRSMKPAPPFRFDRPSLWERLIPWIACLAICVGVGALAMWSLDWQLGLGL